MGDFLSAPPAFMAGIPRRLLVRRDRPGPDLRRANELVKYCEDAGYRPSFLEIERERARR